MSDRDIHLANCLQRRTDGEVDGGYVTVAGERYYRIGNVDRMPPFFMSLVSASDLWMFVSSNGGLSAGRVDAESALFPYYTDDKLTENSDNTGPKTVLLVTRGARRSLWEPFSERHRGLYLVERHLYKNVLGNKILFEEINLDLGLVYRYGWRTSDAYGFVKTSWLTNQAPEPCSVELLDGLQNILPYGVSTAVQNGLSNLLDAYKRSELEPRTGLGLFTMSSTLTDLAEPSESLKATTVWQLGFERATYLLSSSQLAAFRQGRTPSQEFEIRGRRGAYFVHAEFDLAPGAERRWSLVAEVEQDHARLASLLNALEGDRDALAARVEADLDRGHEALATLVARADGAQWTADRLVSARHTASTLFNIMRGGIFSGDGAVGKADLLDLVGVRNRSVLERHGAFFQALPDPVDYHELIAAAAATGSPDLERLCHEYLPLTFSRRHGDPSRPWNRFAIHVRHPDGRPRLDYQGNWRDLFQNWEALAYAFPGFVEGMVCRFLNATTADGYNPYRVTRDGIEWEVPEPDNPWANIGYWSDHQIIYLLKLLEVSNSFHPGVVTALLQRRIFSHANVPYRIAPYEAMLENPYQTIAFDADLHRAIEAAVEVEGSDARLLRDRNGDTLHVTMTEKLLLLLLVKLANLVPEGGIWMNTQRPEWNDANNALVGKGLSVVTTCYLYRYVRFLRELLAGADVASLTLSCEVADLFGAVHRCLHDHAERLQDSFDDRRRRQFMDGMGRAGSAYRTSLYAAGLSGEPATLQAATLQDLLELAERYLEHTLRSNRREDGLFHAYNLLTFEGDGAKVAHLAEMLEGQVAILSSGLLTSTESLELLESLEHGRLFRQDQRSYLLYPDRSLPSFLSKNRIPPGRVRASALIAALLERDDRTLVVGDEDGVVHFNATFGNAGGVRRALEDLGRHADLTALVGAEGEQIVALFEQIFDHASFTGRSGTFFAYEGLGSIYWHMVSKLLLAVQESYWRASQGGEAPEVLAALKAGYDRVRSGLGFNKRPVDYGAFPTDPYSHTPAHAGAQQPGMTGQVKEDILTRLGELGVHVEHGRLGFRPEMLSREEFLLEATSAQLPGLGGLQTLALEPGMLAFTLCQVPIVYRLDDAAARVVVTRRDGAVTAVAGSRLDAETSRELFDRTGAVVRIDVTVPQRPGFTSDPYGASR